MDLMTLVDAALLLLPAVGFVLQLQQTTRDRRMVFSSWWALGLLVAHIVRLSFCYWVGLAASPAAAVLAFQSAAVICVQLLLLRLVTRVATEQRMLPSSLFRRISFRWKYLRRHFWQWDDFPSYLLVVAAFAAAVFFLSWLLDLIFPPHWLLSSLALLAFTVESVAMVPQILKNRVEGVDGLSAALVVSLLVGDAARTLRFASWDAVILLTGCVQLLLDLYLLYQWYALRRMVKMHEY